MSALTDAERSILANDVLGGAAPSSLMVRAVERIIAERDAARLALAAGVEALAKDWQRASDEFTEGNGGWNKVMRYKDAATDLRALLSAQEGS